ncbi:MAG TPA: hypothetical protein VNT54_06845 [Solirubrobacteraceae bacterium]|nr:hypothetical protein [Solirubrobacteraceae bacterium]
MCVFALERRVRDEPVVARSHLEALMRDLCDAHRLPRPEVSTLVDGSEAAPSGRRPAHRQTDAHETHGFAMDVGHVPARARPRPSAAAGRSGPRSAPAT